ncbi:MAG: serine/threonine-protein kinase [Planctomycetales bacterium]
MAADSHSAVPVPPTGVSREASPAEGRQMLGKYELRRKIGAGGMGAVYLAFDTQLRRTVALKILPRDKANNPVLVRRFHAEAQAAAQLRHDNIVTVYEAGEAEGYLYMALEYVPGTDVQALVARGGPLGIERGLEIVKQAARALRHAYERGIVHRDIKPSNLLVSEDGIVKLADMGLARSVDETVETGITRAGTTVGTVDYMAPEQARDSKSADIRSDIYSLGCTWYQMLTGVPPFPGGSLTNKLYAHSAKARPDPRAIAPQVPEVIVHVLHRMMAKSPQNRYRTPEELLDDLERIDLEAETGEMLSRAALDKILDSTGEFDGPHDALAARVAERFAEAGQANSIQRRLPPRVSTPRSAARAGAMRSRFSPATLRVGGIVAAIVAIVGIAWWMATRNGGAPQENVPEGPVARTGDGGSPVLPKEPVPALTPGPIAGAPLPGSNPEPPRPGPAPAVPVAPALGIGRAGEGPYLPAWIAGMPSPERAMSPRAAEGLLVLKVGRQGDGPPGQFASLEEALDAVPAGGAVVHLVGNGPFVLPGREFADRGRLVLAASEPDARPVVVLRFDPSRGTEAIVSLRNTSLTLAGVHVVFETGQLPPGAKSSLFAFEGGEFAVRNCSVTATGNQPGEFTAFHALGTVATRVLLDRSFIRGNRLTTLRVEQPACEAVFWNCLAVSGDAPVVLVEDGLAGNGPSARRRVAVISSTLSAGKEGFRLSSAATGGGPPETAIVTVNSLLCGRRGESPGMLASLADWPLVDPADRSVNVRFWNLNWTAHGSLVAGWGELARWGAAPEEAVAGHSSWQRLWSEPADAGQFRQAIWPREAIVDCGSIAPETFERETFPGAPGSATDGAPPGCDVALLEAPDAGQARQAAALARRPVPPARFVDRDAPALVINVDLARQDLGALLAARNWPSGTLVVGTGRGNCSSSPIRVRDKALRIELKSSDQADPLVLVAKPLNTRELDPAAGIFDAFLSVKGGSLEVAGGSLRLPSSSSGSIPNWLLHAEDSSFLVEDCGLAGPMFEKARHQGLIRWSRAQERPLAALDPPVGQYEHHALIEGCFLLDNGKLLHADMRDRGLTIRNSTLVGFDDLFALNVGGGNRSRIAAAVRIERSTLAAGRSFFDVSTSLLSRLAAEPLTFFVDSTVFLRAGDSDAMLDPTVLTCLDTARQERQLDWWGSRNAYAVSRYLRQVGTAAGGGPQDFDRDWRGAWGAERVADALAGAGAASLRTPLESLRRSQLERGSFALAPDSPAARWRADGRSLGDPAGGTP